MKWTLLLLSNANAGSTVSAQITAHLVFDDKQKANNAKTHIEGTLKAATATGVLVLVTRIE